MDARTETHKRAGCKNRKKGIFERGESNSPFFERIARMAEEKLLEAAKKLGYQSLTYEEIIKQLESGMRGRLI
jgi:hypothetical protein